MAIPESVILKILRAKEHYDTFVAEMHGEFQSHAGRLVVEIDPFSNSVRQTFTAPLPPRFALIVGDCLDNLRSALDFVVWELVLAANGVPSEKNTFPVCDAPRSFKDATRSRLSGLTPKMITEIDLMQPYRRGNDLRSHPLWCLNKLANVNKHRRVLLVSVHADWAGKLIGTDRYTLAAPGSKMHVDIHPAAYVALNEREIVQGAPDVSSVVSQLISEVERLMPNFQQFF